MREITCTLTGMLISWLAIFFIVPVMGFDIKMWVLILSASIGSLFTGFFVLLGETVIENIILVLFTLVITGVLWGTTPGIGFIFISALLAGVTGTITNQINQYAAKKTLQLDAAEPPRRA